jgi:hypothetical protein
VPGVVSCEAGAIGAPAPCRRRGGTLASAGRMLGRSGYSGESATWWRSGGELQKSRCVERGHEAREPHGRRLGSRRSEAARRHPCLRREDVGESEHPGEPETWWGGGRERRRWRCVGRGDEAGSHHRRRPEASAPRSQRAEPAPELLPGRGRRMSVAVAAEEAEEHQEEIDEVEVESEGADDGEIRRAIGMVRARPTSWSGKYSNSPATGQKLIRRGSGLA